MYNVDILLSIAQREIDNVNVGEVFLLRELFKGYEWNRIKISDRLLLGTLFLDYVNTKPDKIIALQKTSSNQQKYKRI